MNILFLVLMLLSVIGLVVGLIKPSWLKLKSRKQSSLIFGISTILFFFLIGVTSDPKPSTSITQTNSQVVAEEIPNTGIQNEVVKAISVPESNFYSVTGVVDGDTLKISMDGKEETLRLIGIDTPETVDPRKPVQCFGKEASNKAKELLVGKKIRIEADSTQDVRDKYGRLLAYIYREDGLFYNKHMIEQGYAHEYTYEIPYKYQAEFKAAQKLAQDNNRGLWSENTCGGNRAQTSTPTEPPPSSTSQPQNPSPVTSSTGDKDCKDFKTQAAAQAYFDSKGGSSTNNVDKLDGSDKDGKVCESLP